MKYENVTEGIFLSRPNRFTANVLIDGKEEICHVKNTGRCRELLVPEARVILSEAKDGSRRTAYDLIAVYKKNMLINMDSQSPNKAVYEWLKENGDFSLIRPEYTIGDSRFDFYCEKDGIKTVIEVKGVTLEENGAVRFPDAPTERGVKHLKGLMRLAEAGYDSRVFFAVQMNAAEYFEPNRKTDPVFADTLSEAYRNGVKIICRKCKVTPDSMVISEELEIRL